MRYLFTLLLLFDLLNIKAQTADPSAPTIALRTDLIGPSPNAASLGKYGLIPVSLYTGIPEISIDLGSVSGRELSLPISLSYHHNGLKPYETASWVGLGWSINAGGVITRIIKDKVDETTPTQYRYDQNSAQFNAGETLDQDFLDGALYYGTYDTEPDLYAFNFGKYSGTFFFYNGQIYQFPYQKINITGTPSGPFLITTEDGTIYTFGATEATNPKATAGQAYTVPTHISSWYLSSVDAADKSDHINLYYSAAENIVTHGPSSQSYMQITSGGTASILNPIQQSSTSTVQAIRLTSIESSRMSVSFIPQTTARTDINGTTYALDAIRFTGVDGTILKNYKLNYSYFNPGNQEASPLKLLSISRMDGNSDVATAQTHTFTYNENGSIFPMLTNAVDHWGFVNGVSDPGTLIPNTIMSGGANREPNDAYSSIGMLTKITYPTGGETTFEYEPNVCFTDNSYKVSSQNLTLVANRPSGQESDNTLLTASGQFTITNQQNIGIFYSRTPKIPVSSDPNDPNGPDAPAKDISPELAIHTEAIYPSDPSYSIYYNRDNTGVSTTLSLAPNTYYVTEQCDSKELSTTGSITYTAQTNVPNDGMKGPGLRIKKISSYTGIAGQSPLAFERDYTYKDSLGFSTGILRSGINYGGNYSYLVTNYSATDGEPYDKTYLIYNSAINSALGDLINQQMYYSEVYEVQTTPNETLMTRYKFTSFDNSYDYMNTGVFPTEETTYLTAGGSYNKLNEKNYSYGIVSTIGFNAIKPHQIKQVLGATSERLRTYDEDLYSLSPATWVYKIKESDVNYYDSGNVITYTIFHNDIQNTHNLISTNKLLSNGNQLVTKFKYPESYSPSVMQSFTDQHVLSPIIEQQQWIKRSVTDSVMISGKIYDYDNVLFKPKTEYLFESSAPVTSLNQESVNSSGQYTSLLSDSKYVNRIVFTYDTTTANLTSQDMTGSNGIKQAVYLYGYNNTLPIAECKNGAISDFFYTSFEDGGSNTSSGGGHTGSYFYNGHYQINFSVGTNPSGYRYTYWYRLNGIWKFSGELTYTGVTTISVGDAIDDVCVYPVNAQMTTYTYDPLVGMTSSTDAKGEVTYYEYDGLQRLLNIKDKDGNVIKHMSYHYQGQ